MASEGEMEEKESVLYPDALRDKKKLWDKMFALIITSILTKS